MRITEIFFRDPARKGKTKYAIGRGKPLPFGATVTAQGINFAIFAEHATSVTLVLMKLEEPTPFLEVKLEPKYNKTGHVWHVHIFELKPPVQYGYYVDGPWQPELGHRYQRDVLLLDPYANTLSGGKTWGKPKANPASQNVLKRYSTLVEQPFDWEGDSPLVIPMQDTIIYEMHVRGFTQHPSAQTEQQGTFRGIIDKIPYLRELGITAVELMPICEFDENDNTHTNPVTGEQLKNFWGYNTVSFFSPKAAFAANQEPSGHLQEFREMVRALHKAGIEVILDVVFNHTAEGNEQGPQLHFRGLDNSVYYLLGPNGVYLNFSGCGNTVNCNHPLIRDLIRHCLYYWVTEMHVDGFRFDLAAILGRDEKGEVQKNPPIVERIARDPVLSNTKLIAEAWDAAGLYQVGSFPACGRWAEWNGKFRDDIRCFLRGSAGTVTALATRLLGSPDLYNNNGRYPYHSINFITSHDGFTLHDLVAYHHKHNETNGEGNQDGNDENFSWNCGAEGDSSDPEVLQLRNRQMKNFLAVLLLSQGVPMILAGDEFGRTQRGNNNAYCQDNEISWLDWSLLKQNQDLYRFTKEMIAFRKRHPSLRRINFINHNAYTLQHQGIQWHGVKLSEPDWSYHSHAIAFLLEGQAVPGGDNDIYVAINSYWETLTFAIPTAPSQKPWHLMADTAQPTPHDIVPETGAAKRYLEQWSYPVAPRSVIVLVAC